MSKTDMLKACVIKEYVHCSYRRLISHLKYFKDILQISRIPHFNTVRKYMADNKFREWIYMIVQTTGRMLSDVETIFAVDATGFGTSAKVSWVDIRYKKPVERKDYTKLHAIIGYKTGIIAAIKVTNGTGSDVKQFPELYKDLTQRYHVKEISGDKAYLSKKGIKMVFESGGVPFFRLKDNTKLSMSEQDKEWNQVIEAYHNSPEKWLKNYHRRSNAESAFSKIKRKFGARLKSKNHIARITELLIKVLIYNRTIIYYNVQKYPMNQHGQLIVND